MRWIVDANNVMGAGGDGWWNDPAGASVQLAQRIAEWCRDPASTQLPDEMRPDTVVLVFDGRPDPRIGGLAGGPLTIEFARRPGRDAADDRIVELVDDLHLDPVLTVVTSDRGLAARLAPGVRVEGAGAFRRRIGLRPNGAARPRRW